VIRNIIFDWSGTLVDDLPAVWAASNHVFSRAGLKELSLDEFRAEFCLPFQLFYNRYTPHVPLEQLETWFHGHFKQVQHLVAELPHARDFLKFCRDRKLRTFLLSTIHRDHFAEQSTRLGFAEYLDRPYIEVMDKRRKICDLLAENGLDAGETVFIGDMQHDIETAKHGGVMSCAVLTGFNRLDQLRASEPDVIVEHLGELRSLLEQGGMELRRTGQALPIATVGGLIFNGAGQVLMIRTRKWSHLWGIPGGKIHLGEPSETALLREIKEETSLDVSEVRFVLVQDCIHSKEFYRDAHFLLLNYTCRCAGTPEVTLNDEAEDYRWVGIQEALAMPLNQPTRILIEAVIQRGK
jgi:phosphoglycolate phosphatase